MMGSGPEERGAAPPRSVVLAEDDDDLRELLSDALRAEGFHVVECQDGLSLVEAVVSRFEAGERPFDLIVSDVRMPGVTGLSLLEGLAHWDELRNQPIVLITAFGEPRLRTQAQRFGAVSLLEKPFEMSALLRIVRATLAGPGAGFVHA